MMLPVKERLSLLLNKNYTYCPVPKEIIILKWRSVTFCMWGTPT
jgi:hypothetical protein